MCKARNWIILLHFYIKCLKSVLYNTNIYFYCMYYIVGRANALGGGKIIFYNFDIHKTIVNTKEFVDQILLQTTIKLSWTHAMQSSIFGILPLSTRPCWQVRKIELFSIEEPSDTLENLCHQWRDVPSYINTSVPNWNIQMKLDIKVYPWFSIMDIKSQLTHSWVTK